MKKSRARRFLNLFADLQEGLFQCLEAECGELSGHAKLLVSVLGLTPVQPHLPTPGGWVGRPAKHRRALASAFVAKAVYGLNTTRQLIERLRCDRQLLHLCGWNDQRSLPHESTFSRAFEEFAQSELPHRLHAALIMKTQRERIIGHMARDSTAIEAREKFPEAKPEKDKPKRRPKCRKGAEHGTRIKRQRRQALAEQLASLSKNCAIGVKKSSKGDQQYWRGYKLHLDVADGQIPISALLTGANVHDSQAAIPLMTMSTARVTYLYDLMDAAYDAAAIREYSVQLGHQPIIDGRKRSCTTEYRVPRQKNSRSWKRIIVKEMRAPEFTWAERDRFTERTMVERVFSRLKDEFGFRSIRVRGATKVMAHLMFGVLVLTVDQLIKLSG